MSAPAVAPVTPPDGNWANEGAEVLTDVERFLGQFVAYPYEAAHVAHTLWCAHTHAMDAWEATPRLAFLSPEPASGKSRGWRLPSCWSRIPSSPST